MCCVINSNLVENRVFLMFSGCPIDFGLSDGSVDGVKDSCYRGEDEEVIWKIEGNDYLEKGWRLQ